MSGKRRAVRILGVLALLCGAPAGAATIHWNVVGGTPSGNAVLVDRHQVTLELIAELGPDEPRPVYATVSVRATTIGEITFSSRPHQVLLTSTVNGVAEPWYDTSGPCDEDVCYVVRQGNPRWSHPSDYLDPDPFEGVIATVNVDIAQGQGTVSAVGGLNFFGAAPASVRLLLIPEPTSAALLALGLVSFAVLRRR